MEQTKTEAAAILAAGAAISARDIWIKDDAEPFIVLPDGYVAAPLEIHLSEPCRKRGKIVVTDASGFTAYMLKHAESRAMIYADVDTIGGKFELVGVINDHASDRSGWRDHTCTLSRKRSVEWGRWASKNKSPMPQAEFAAWIEDNLADIAAVEGMPTGSDMLQMALGFERTSEKRLKSRINLQSGGFRLEYVDDEDKDTRTSMEVFSRFAIGIPVFDGSASAYQIDARLKYRESSGKLSFWFELIRQDRVFRQAVEEEVMEISKATGLTIINGNPGL